jgi:hypothetical protein
VSDARLDIVRRLTQAFEDRDAGIAEHFASDVIMHAPDGWPEPGPLIGRDEVIGQFTRLGEDWQSHTLTIEQAETRPGAAVVRLLWKTTGAASEIALGMEISGTYFFRDGLIHELGFFWSWDEAVAAAERGPSR